MKHVTRILILLVFGLLTSLASNPVQAVEAQAGWYKNIVDFTFVKEYATVPMRDDVMVIDSRPARSFDPGYISPAVSIPDRGFDKMVNLLPADKSTLLIFYCGGEKCMLSHQSAVKAEALGYSNIKVYAAGYPDWIKKGGMGSISAAYLKKQMDKAKVVTIDSRPARAFKAGHVPGAVNIPDRSFDKMVNMLPTDKDAALTFYCGGYKCPLSASSAAKAVKAGYKNVTTFQAGYPAWTEAYGVMTAAADPAKAVKVAIDTGEDADTISFESFNNIVKNAPDSVYLIDVRSREEFNTGNFKGSIHMTVDDVEDKVAELPSDKPIIFVCSTGTRSGEAYDIVKLIREDMKVYFLNALVTHARDGTYKLESPT
ncbi:MAG: rhodanese-like domain-containing protein [Rhodospirillales bacterium]|nr:rhodanese-like domain-containing protein [Rhodospirillales bacterium]